MRDKDESMEESFERNQANSFKLAFSQEKINEIPHGFPNFGCIASVITLEAR